MKVRFSTLFFALLAFLISSTTLLTSCRKDTYQVTSYFGNEDRDTLLTNIITYMGPMPPGATNETRFSPIFRGYYVGQLPKYRFEQYFITADSTHYYFISRPVGNGRMFKRGVGGKFRLKKGSILPVAFEEMWCTPHFKEDSLVQVRGGFLFRAMVKDGNVDKYLTMKHYVEWPDARLRYDKKRNEWVSTMNY